MIIFIRQAVWGINFYWFPNPLSKVFFSASCLCGVMDTTLSDIFLITSFTCIFVAEWIGSLGAQSFNRLSKCMLHMGNVISGKIVNAKDISELRCVLHINLIVTQSLLN